MPEGRSPKEGRHRRPRYNLSISPISGLEAYFGSQNLDTLIKCVVWNASSEGACILLNGTTDVRVGDECSLICNASFEKNVYIYNCVVRWVTPEVFVTFLGLSFDDLDNNRDEFFNSFRQLD